MIMRSKFLISLAAIAITTFTLTAYAEGDDVGATTESHRHHQRMTTEEKETWRQQMRERHEQMTPEEREALRAKRQEQREQYKKMTPEERQAHHQEKCQQKGNLSAEECAQKYTEMKERHKEHRDGKHKGKRKHKHGDKTD